MVMNPMKSKKGNQQKHIQDCELVSWLAKFCSSTVSFPGWCEPDPNQFRTCACPLSHLANGPEKKFELYFPYQIYVTPKSLKG